MKCENCDKEKHIVDITNYTFKVIDNISFNCCCKKCARNYLKEHTDEFIFKVNDWKHPDSRD